MCEADETDGWIFMLYKISIFISLVQADPGSKVARLEPFH